MAKKNPLTARSGAIFKNTTNDKRCLVCLEPLSGRRLICSPRCRLLKWAANALVEAWRTGRAKGLADLIEDLRKP